LPNGIFSIIGSNQERIRSLNINYNNMGRYYTGDINGKFAFGIQASDDADFFGQIGSQPNYLEYEYTTEDLPNIKKGLATCKKELGNYKKKIDKYFNDNPCYNDDEMAKSLDIITTAKLRELLQWYYRYQLGEKIYKQVKKTGSCSFEAEL
jgi:hypothetical protein